MNSRAIGARLGKSVPLMANMVEGGKTPMLPAANWKRSALHSSFFPAAIVRTLAKAAEDFYASLKAHSSTDPFRARMLDFDALNACSAPPKCWSAASATLKTVRKAAHVGAAMTCSLSLRAGRTQRPVRTNHDESEKVQ